MDVIEWAERLAFYKTLDAPAFAKLMLDDQFTEGSRIADYIKASKLEAIFTQSMRNYNKLKEQYDPEWISCFAFLEAQGVVTGYLLAKIEEEKESEDDG